MYKLNINPDKKAKYSIQLDPTGKFYQLTGQNVGTIAESDSWRRLKKYAEELKLNLYFLQD